MQNAKQMIVLRPGIEPDTKLGSPAGETYHYRYASDEKMEPPVFVYRTTLEGEDSKWGGEGPNFEVVFGATRTAVQQKLETYLEAAGYEVRSQVEVVQDASDHKTYFPTTDISISAPNIEIGVTVPEADPNFDGLLVKPGSVMIVGGDIQSTPAGKQPTICHLIDHSTGDVFTIPPYISDQEVLALIQARRQYVRENSGDGAVN